MGDYEDFKAMKTRLNLTNEDIAKITGLSLNSIKRSVGRSNFNRYLKLTLWVYGHMQDSERTKEEINNVFNFIAVHWIFKEHNVASWI